MTRLFSEKFLFTERENLPLFIPVVLGIGILIGVFFPFVTWGSLISFLVISCSISVVTFKRQRIISLLIFFLTLGIYVAQTGGILETKLLTQKKFISKEYDQITFMAKVKFIDETHPTMKNMRRITLKDIEFLDKAHSEELSFIKSAKMTCSSRMTRNVQPNDIVRIRGKLNPFKPPAIPGSFDQLQYNSLVKLDATGIAYKIEKTGTSSKGIDYFSQIRRILTKKVIERMRNPAGGISSALLTGDKSSIPPQIREIFINSGTAHILAISGLHMSIVASIFFLIFFRLSKYITVVCPSYNPRVISAILTIPVTFFYLGLSGFSPSSVRAFIMTSTFLIGIICGRGVISLRSIALAAFIILLFDSGSLFLVSFQLSFCAVVALTFFYETFQLPLYILQSKFNTGFLRAIFYVIASLISTFIATLATSPISIAVFNRFSLSGLIGNLIAIPVVTFLIMPLGGLCFLSDFFVRILEFILNNLVTILEYISKIPGSNLVIKSPSLFALYSIITGGIVICLLKSKEKYIYGSGLIAVGTLLWTIEQKPTIIIPPQIAMACFIEDGKFYTTSLQKGRRAALSIQRNLGFDGKLVKRPISNIPTKEYRNGLFIWKEGGQYRELSERKHPYCPMYYVKAKKFPPQS